MIDISIIVIACNNSYFFFSCSFSSGYSWEGVRLQSVEWGQPTHLSRVEEVIRVDCSLHFAHQLDSGLTQLVNQVDLLPHTNTMLACTYMRTGSGLIDIFQ